jgi:hypothetical protein
MHLQAPLRSHLLCRHQVSKQDSMDSRIYVFPFCLGWRGNNMRFITAGRKCYVEPLNIKYYYFVELYELTWR